MIYVEPTAHLLCACPNKPQDQKPTAPTGRHLRIAATRYGRRTLFLAACLIAVNGATGAGQAAEERGVEIKQTEQVRFDIPSEPLVTALEAYSTVSGLQVLYDSRLASGLVSEKVEGVFTPEAALKVLIGQTSLMVRFTKLNDVVLVPASMEDGLTHAVLPIDGPVLSLDTLRVEGSANLGRPVGDGSYAGVVQAEIQAALRRNARTRSGNYRVGVNLWFDRSGTIERSEIFRSSGDRDRDAVISAVLQEITISKAPPEDMRQPLSVAITALAF